MEKINKNNRDQDDLKSVSEQEASSSGTRILDGDSTTASDPDNFDQADQQDLVKSNEVMKPSQSKLVGHASPTNDGASNSRTLDKSKSNKTHGEKENDSKDPKDGASTKPRNLGMIDNLRGANYQKSLSSAIVCRIGDLIKNGEKSKFKITNEDKEGGLFDDIVVKSDDGDIFIQAKHKEDTRYIITWNDLTSTDKKARFALCKYLNSFQVNGWDKRKKSLKLALCTNARLHGDVKKSVAEYPFGTNIVDTILKSITNDAYTIDLNNLKEENKNELLQYFKDNSELATLANVLAESIVQRKVVDFRNESVQAKCRFIIENKIAAEKINNNGFYKVNKEFFDKNGEFKELFENECRTQQSKKLIWDDIQKKGINLEKNLKDQTKEKHQTNQNQCSNITEESDLNKLATMLVDHIYYKKAVDFQIDVFKKYRNVIEDFAKDQKKEKSFYEFNSQRQKKTWFKEFERLFNIEYLKLLNPAEQNIWEVIQSNGICLSKKNQSDANDELPNDQVELPKPVTDDLIEKFLTSCLIVCNTTHEKKQVVDSILESNLLPENIRDRCSADHTLNKVETWIWERMQDKFKTPIDGQDIDKQFKQITSSLNFSQLKDMSHSNCSRFLDLELEFKQGILQETKVYKKLVSWFTELNNSGKDDYNVDIEQLNYPSLIVIHSLHVFNSKLNYLYFKDTQFREKVETIMSVFFEMDFPLILVIDCESMTAVFLRLSKYSNKFKSMKTIKKIILIDRTFSASEGEWDLLFRDLTDTSKEKVINQIKIANFYGTKLSRNEFIRDEDNINFVIDIVEFSATTDRGDCDKIKTSFEKIKDMYVQRKCKQCNKYESGETSIREVWDAIEVGETLSELFLDEDGKDKISYETFFRRFSVDTSKINNISLHKETEHKPPGVDGNPKVHVIFDEAGSGKSYYMTWLARKLQLLFPSWWIIRFNLYEYSMVFDQSQKSDNCQSMDELVAIRFIFQLVYLEFSVENRLQIDSNEILTYALTISKALEFSGGCLKLDENEMKTVLPKDFILLRIFEHKFNSKQIVILMDGFDEIAPDYKTVVLKLLSMLKTFDGICKLYLSTRPYDLRNELEITLQDCSWYRLIEFDDGDKCSFIHRYLKQIDKYKLLDNEKQARTCYVIFILLGKFLQDITANPLFLSMRVEQLKPMVEKYFMLQEENIDRHIIEGWENVFELLSTVERFVEIKINIMNLQKSGLTNALATIACVKKDIKLKFEMVKEILSLLALYTIFSSWEIDLFLTADQQTTASDRMKDVNNAVEKSGLIEGVIKNKPIFIHRLIAEYFVALWFYSNQRHKEVKSFLKCKVYEVNDRNNIKIFLDRMICRDNPLHMSVLGGSLLKTKSMLTNDSYPINKRDEWGRTPLHLAFLLHASKSRNDILELLLRSVHEDILDLKDKYFGWYTLDYAYCGDIKIHDYNRNLYDDERTKLYCVRTLLQKVTSIDAPKMLSRFSTKDHFKMCTSIASGFAHNDLSDWISYWGKAKGSDPLTNLDSNEFFSHFSKLLQFLHFEIMSNDNCRKIQNLELECKIEILQETRLYKMLDLWASEVKGNRANDGRKVDIEKFNHPPLIVFHLLQIFKSALSYLIFEDRQFKDVKEAILKGFIERESPHILVIESRLNHSLVKYLEEWVEERSTKTFKKILLIGPMFSATLEAERDVLVLDLTDESKERVINQTKITNFYGTEISRNKLLHDEDKIGFVLYVIEFSSGADIKCNKLQESYEKIKDMFIHRKWEQCDTKKLRETSSRSFWYARKKGLTLNKLFPRSLTDNRISFETFLDYNYLDIEEINSILLHRNSEYTHPPGIDKNTQDEVESNSSDFDLTDHKVHVIFNEAGSGKSFYLTWLASYLQYVKPSWWIIKFNLNEYSMDFDQLQNRGECETIDELISIRFLFQLVYLAFHVENRLLFVSNGKSSYAQMIAEALVFSNGCLKLDENKMKTVSCEELILLRIFEHKFKTRQIAILMDGFDEIAPDYKTVVLKLLSMLKTFDGICKVYLSSRPYGLRNEIETTLKDCTCYRLVEFNDEDQHIYMHRYLLNHIEEYKSSDDTKQAKTCRVVFEILRKMLGDLMEIPLFLSMGIELLIPIVEDYVNVEEETISKQIIEDCENSFELLNMVESFVEKKFNITNIMKTGSAISSFKTVQGLNHAKRKLDKVLETHSLLGLCTKMTEDDVVKLLTKEQQNSALQYMVNVKNGLEKSGLIEGVTNNRPIFNHMLFAEYFAAMWFYSNQNVTVVKEFLKRKVYETDDKIEIRQLLDRMICRRSPLHMAVLDGSTLKMDSILTKEPHLINARDEWGRTPLHLAISLPANLGSQDIIEFLLDRVDKDYVNLKDSYFKWFTLDYAYCADITNLELFIREPLEKWHYVLTLLNKGASIDTPEMLSRFSKTDKIEDLLLIEFDSDRKFTSNFETFFTKVVQVVGPKKVLNLMVSRYDFKRREIYIFRNLSISYIDPPTILEFCIRTDSLMFKILMENSYDPKSEHANERHLTLAFEFHSINVLEYFIVDRPFDLSAIKDNFEQELCVLLVYMQCDEQKFKSLFHDYCSRYKIACLEETAIDKSKTWIRGFSTPTEHFPTEFEKREDTSIDTGTEFLISRALKLDNASAVDHLFYTTKTNLDNRLIRQILRNCEIKWCCLSSYHCLLDNSIDLTDTDENGRNLLHFAADYGDLNLVKCLINHYGFKPSEINAKENNWNAFFYCASSCKRNDSIKNIFAYMLEKDPVDCFGQLDAKGKSIFYYAVKNNRSISDYIFKRKFEYKL